MSNLTSKFKSLFKKTLFPLGFKLYKNTFYRVVNDVIQTLMLVRTDSSCTVEFDITPLALGIEDLNFESFYSISRSREGNMKGWDWQFVASSLHKQNVKGDYETIVFNDGSIDNIVENMLKVTISHIIPIFEKGIDCKSALDVLRNYELITYGKELYKAKTYGVYLTYIKIGNYDKAISYLRENIQKMLDNPYDIKLLLDIKQQHLNIAKLKYELVTSENFQLKKNDILVRDDVDEDFKKQLILSDTIYKAKPADFVSSLESMISMFENEIEQLLDVNSSMTIELKVKEIEHSNKMKNEIEYCYYQIELLSIPDVEYFQKLISENEARSISYLLNPK